MRRRLLQLRRDQQTIWRFWRAKREPAALLAPRFSGCEPADPQTLCPLRSAVCTPKIVDAELLRLQTLTRFLHLLFVRRGPFARRDERAYRCRVLRRNL